MRSATRSRTKPRPAKKDLNLVPNPHAARKRCRKPNCREYCSALRPLSPQSRLMMLNNMRNSVITISQVQAGKAPEPKTICTDEKEDTPKPSPAPVIRGSNSNIEAGELASAMLQSDLELDEGFSPEAFEAISSLEELLSRQPNSSAATPTAEGALPASQRVPSRATPAFEALAPLHVGVPKQPNTGAATPTAEGGLSSVEELPASQRVPSRAGPASEAMPLLCALLSRQPNPLCAATRAEEAVTVSSDQAPTTQRDPSRATPAFEAPNSFCTASRAEEPLNLSRKKPPTSQRDPSRATPTFEALPNQHLPSQPNPPCAAPRAGEALSNCEYIIKIIYLLGTCYETVVPGTHEVRPHQSVTSPGQLRPNRRAHRSSNKELNSLPEC
ncbi:hypothetical protein [Diadegma fenestrale ichnovirus]|nr:hypothetical protein [Diadegma fenestrale ichnovirus]